MEREITAKTQEPERDMTIFELVKAVNIEVYDLENNMVRMAQRIDGTLPQTEEVSPCTLPEDWRGQIITLLAETRDRIKTIDAEMRRVANAIDPDILA